MNANIGEGDIIADKTLTIQTNLEEKLKVKHIVYRFIKRLIFYSEKPCSGRFRKEP